MGYRIPDFGQAPRQTYQQLLVENRSKGRSVPEAGALALEIALSGKPSELEAGQNELWLTYEATLAEVEADGRSKNRRGVELAYHNRQHVGDCLLALACLFRFDRVLPDSLRLLGLVVMAGHDLGHQGLTNEQLGGPSEQERQTLARLTEGAWRGLKQEHCELAGRLLIGTDPALVASNHVRLASVPNPERIDLLQVYINEADIAGSLHPALAMAQTQALLMERNEPSSSAHAQATYSAFLTQARVSTVPGRLLLG